MLKKQTASHRPKNAFMFFAKEERQRLQQKDPSIKLGEMQRILSTKWYSMDTQDKEKYYDMVRELSQFRFFF